MHCSTDSILKPAGLFALVVILLAGVGDRSSLAEASRSQMQDLRPNGSSSVEQLVRRLESRDPIEREQAIARLVTMPEQAADAVIEALCTGELATRLAALDVLIEWQSPVGTLDPWRPETFTPENLDRLRQWTPAPGIIEVRSTDGLSQDERQRLQLDLQRMSRSPDVREVSTICERLARYGHRLTHMLEHTLSGVEDDTARQRLTALRYRLDSDPARARTWPGGLDRLASTDPVTRREAIQELAGIADERDVTLLVTLSEQPDALVRDVSLRTLGGLRTPEVNQAFVRFISSSDDHLVRASLAVMAESPQPAAIDALRQLASSESDADLLALITRALRASGDDRAVESLLGLAQHDAWQVRAGAAEAMGGLLTGTAVLTHQSRADACTMLVSMLGDIDAFVAARAEDALRAADPRMMTEPLLLAVADHPDQADRLLAMLTADEKQAAPPLRLLTRHDDARVRAAALRRLCELAPRSTSTELLAGLRDEDRGVRIAACEGSFTVLDAYRSDHVEHRRRQRQTSGITLEATTGPADTVHLDDVATGEAWLSDFKTGERRPAWTNELVQPLKELLEDPASRGRFAAARALIPLGRDESLSLVAGAVRDDPTHFAQAADVLAWLHIDERISFFGDLMTLAQSTNDTIHLARAMACWPHPRAAAPVWKLIEQDNADLRLVVAVCESLRYLYFDRAGTSPVSLSPERRDHAVDDLWPRSIAGSDTQRLAAMSLLLTASCDRAADAARLILADTKARDSLRRDALHVLLLSRSPEESIAIAVSCLQQDEDSLRQTALRFLADGRSLFSGMHQGAITLHVANPALLDALKRTPGQVIRPAPPPGLSVETIAPLTRHPDAQTRARAGYLLALLGDETGLPLLVDHWHREQRGDEAWTRLVYRAVVALNHDASLPLLESIYERFDPDDRGVPEFYWTLRSMSGEPVAELRARIRREMGMDRLQY